MPNPKKKQPSAKEIERAWKYHESANHLFAQRVNFFLVAESMLVVSFVSVITCNKNLYEINLAIASLGFVITFIWFFINARLSIRIKKLKDDYLNHDVVYQSYMNSVQPNHLGIRSLAYYLPNSIMMFWIFMLIYTILPTRDLFFTFLLLVIPSLFLIVIFFKLPKWLSNPGREKKK